MSPLPYPAPTDPAGAAARHIRTLAEATDAKLAAGRIAVATFDTGQVTADVAGGIATGGLPGLASITGAVFGPVQILGGPVGESSYVPALTRKDAGTAIYLVCYNAPTLALNNGKLQRAVGIAWGPKVAADPAPAPAAADTFPRGSTPVAHLRYPGTDEPLWRTAQAVRDLADDTGAAIGGAVPGLALVTWKGNYTTNSSAYFSVDMGAKLSRIRGAVATAWDPGTFVRRSRIFGWSAPRDQDDATFKKTLTFFVYSNEKSTTAGANYPRPMKSESGSALVVMWGDPP
jgi:hypothetical protein